jgi:hypothetical protein
MGRAAQLRCLRAAAAVLSVLQLLSTVPAAPRPLLSASRGGGLRSPVHWQQECGRPLALRGGDAAAAAAPWRSAVPGVIRVPADVGDVDEAIEMVPGAGSTIEFGSRRHVLDEAAIVRWGMRVRLAGARTGGRPPVAQRAEVWGNWTLLQRTMGEWEDLKLGLHCYTSACTLLDIRGGPWEFAHCDTRCIGGVAVQLVLCAKLIMTHCGVGGMDTQFMRAQDGLVCRMDSCADLEHCSLEMCGVLTGYGAHLLEDSRASLRHCMVLDNALGTCAEGDSSLALRQCTLSSNRWAPLYCGLTAANVTWILDSCHVVARCGHVWLTDRRPAVLRTRNISVLHVGPDPEPIPMPQGRLEDYNQHPKFHAGKARNPKP